MNFSYSYFPPFCQFLFRCYLCPMHTRILFVPIILILFPCAASAQFNTIGKVNSRVYTKKSYPTEHVALSDSLPHADTIKAPCVALPLRSVQVSSGYGMRYHPIYHKKMKHNGIDLKAHFEDVFSMLPGRVIQVGHNSRSGHYVSIQTSSYTISYCHLSKVFVHLDDSVKAGTIIAQSGNSGASTAPHLHLTIKKDGKAINPAILLEYVIAKSRVSN